jgi:hypothetical protein
MRRILAVLTMAAAMGTMAADPKEKKETRARKQTQSASNMTGCVDERGETYVLTAEGSMEKRATLRGRAFTDDNFARFVGHKVRVTGESKDGVLHVDKIEKVAETCH